LTFQPPEVGPAHCIRFDLLGRHESVAQLVLNEGALAEAAPRAERGYVVLRTRTRRVPRGERGFSDAIGAVDADQEIAPIRCKGLADMAQQLFGSRQRVVSAEFLLTSTNSPRPDLVRHRHRRP